MARIRIHEATTEASRGKVWWHRIPLLLPLAWIFYRHLADSEYGSIFDGINLAIHAGGHLFFMWFGSDFLMVAGGTLLQCLCPIVTGIMFYKQRDFFAIGIACFWLGTNFADIAPYAADARAPGKGPGRRGVPGRPHDGSGPLGSGVGAPGHGESERGRPGLGPDIRKHPVSRAFRATSPPQG
jgi:hypothetical protein